MSKKKHYELCYAINQQLCKCDSIEQALEVGVDAAAVFVASQFENPYDRADIIEICIKRLKHHKENATKIKP